ncbi:hypothetical protein Tco_0205516 [Tanacetum coccineum]
MLLHHVPEYSFRFSSSDSDDEITTLPIRPTPSSSDRIPSLSGYLLDSGDDSSDEDLSETTESLHTQTASTLVVYSPPTRPLPTSSAFAHRPRKEIPTSLPSLLPSSYSTPSLLPSSSSPPPSLLPSLSRKRPRSPSPPSLPSVSPSPLPLSPLPSPPPLVVPPPPEDIDSVRDDIVTLRASLASSMQEKVTLHARVGLKIIELRSRPEYAESHLVESHNRQNWDGARTQRTDITKQDIETLRARAEAVEQRTETQRASLGAGRMDIRDLIKSREADMLEMAELRSQARDIEASFWDLERHIGP